LATLSDLPFDVLERDPRGAGGALDRLAPDAPFPFGGALAPSRPTSMPMRNACLSCHDPRGAILRDAQTTQPHRMAVARDRDEQLRIVVAAKRARADYQALRVAFTAPE
jgi:hypothetical protein